MKLLGSLGVEQNQHTQRHAFFPLLIPSSLWCVCHGDRCSCLHLFFATAVSISPADVSDLPNAKRRRCGVAVPGAQIQLQTQTSVMMSRWTSFKGVDHQKMRKTTTSVLKQHERKKCWNVTPKKPASRMLKLLFSDYLKGDGDHRW